MSHKHPNETHLEVTGIGFPKWSARGVKQTLEPIGGGEPRRTINGELLDTPSLCAGKYRTLLSGTDKNMPAFAHLRKGLQVEVSCVMKWWEPLVKGKCTLSRKPVNNSVTLLDTTLKPIFVPIQINKSEVSVPSLIDEKEVGDGRWILYRPVLMMRVISWEMQTNERELSTSWRITLEEV